MFQRTLVPLDGSSRAERALPVAARLAQASGGTVVLLRIVNSLGEFGPAPATDAGNLQVSLMLIWKQPGTTWRAPPM